MNHDVAPMRVFRLLLSNTVLTVFTHTTVWFALTYTVYLETRSVLAASILSGAYMVAELATGFWLGGIVDRYRKKGVIVGSGAVALALYAAALVLTLSAPAGAFRDPASTFLWALVLLLLAGSMVGSIRSIALPTLITILVPEDRRDRANGLAGTATGIALLLTSAVSGLLVGYSGISLVLVLALGLLALSTMHLCLLRIPEGEPPRPGGRRVRTDIRGTIAVLAAVPGLLALIGFSSLNNLLSGVYTVLLDPYGLSLMSVQAWGIVWAVLSGAVIIAGLAIARWGLGRNPLATLFAANTGLWVMSCLMGIQPSVVLFVGTLVIYGGLVPVIEAAEQTILQKVVPHERQGRAFGFAHSVEAAAAPLTTLVVGPLTELLAIPFMTTGAGPRLIGGWFGTGPDRGIGLVFTVTGIVGLIFTLIAMRTRAYRRLSARYAGD